MSYHSKETDVFCECKHPEPNGDLLERTNRKFRKYKCKVCDLWWKNQHYKTTVVNK